MEEKLQNTEDTATVETEDTKSGISADLIRGHINTIILRTLYERDKYGYEIIEEIDTKSHGQYTLKQPTLYSALKRLESQGYITAYWKTDEVSNGGRRKYYTLTDSGREITEKNQAEWEYSRTVIDSLISDKNFDFSQPAPTAVDFKILKTSTTRVPNIKDDSDKQESREVKYEEETTTDKEQITQLVNQAVSELIEQKNLQSAPVPVPEKDTIHEAIHEEKPISVITEEQLNEQRRIQHENYLKLVSQPIVAENETPLTPYADANTDKLIYNNKPKTERDYKNLVENLYNRTVRFKEQQTDPIEVGVAPAPVNYDDAGLKAKNDGLTINASEYTVNNYRKKKYNRGITMFKCSLIISVIMLFEFAICLIFRNEMNIGMAYPFVIFSLAAAQLLIFGVLTTTEFGKSTRKPVNHSSYLTTTVVLAIISILIIFIVSILLNINFANAGDIAAKIIVPSLIALNIPAFGALFYVFSK